MAFLRRCLAVLLLISVTAVFSGTTREKPMPIILNDETTREKPMPIILNDETTHEKPIILNDESIHVKPIIQDDQVTKPHPIPLDRYKKGAFELTNPTHVNGEELFESDMLLNPEQKMALRERKAIPTLNYRWTPGASGYPTVPYKFIDAAVNQTAVKSAMTYWEQNSCVLFTPATNLSAPYLKFIYDSGCYSSVGMQYFQNGQDISIGQGCEGLGTVVHEIGHALGFFHEQSRSDRDDYVYINTGNIISGMEYNFDKEVDNNYSVPYDYSSDMHYGISYFTKNGNPTMVAKDPLAQPLIAERNGLSFYDKLLANRMYPCITKWLAACGLASDPCLNKGYTGASCKCICPPGTTGTKCENVTGGYYDSLKSNCSSVVTTAGNITSPNYPNNYPTDLRCMTVIEAPACTTIKLKFNSFELYQQDPYCDNNMCCYFDSLEIRTTDPYNGTLFCDTMISAGQTFTSSTGQMLLYFQTFTDYYSGWSAQLSFIPISNCTSNVTSTTASTTTTTKTTTTVPTTTTTKTTTTVPTTTTTKTTTTVPTTTTTKTTTTATTTKTTTTPPTTTLPPANVCTYGLTNTSQYYWTSPGFGLQNYPNNFKCSLGFTCTAPVWVTVTFNKFSLENSTSTGVCNDFISFTQVYNLANLTYCGLKSGNLNLPTCNLLASFLTNNAINSTGYNVTFAFKSSSCHQNITTGGAGSTGNISAPTSATTWQNTGCEWWIQAPTGNVISLTFKSVSLSGNCTKTSILLNGAGNNQYPTTGSTQYCGTAVPPTFTSTTNKLNVMYYSTTLSSPFQATWTVKAATG